MSRQKSGLETWSDVARNKPNRESIEGYLPIILSAAGALGIAPFAVVRAMNGDWIAATIDFLLMLGIIVLGVIVYRTREVRHAALTISVLCVV